MNFRWVSGKRWQRFGAPVRPIPGCEHDKLVEFSLASFFIGPFIVPIADVQEDEEDRADED